MPKHNPTDSEWARAAAEREIAEVIAAAGSDLNETVARDIAQAIVRSFAYVEVDTTDSKVQGGQIVPLRRLMLTGGWEVADGNALNRRTTETRETSTED
jgi:hypothetical protein